MEIRTPGRTPGKLAAASSDVIAVFSFVPPIYGRAAESVQVALINSVSGAWWLS